MKCNIQVFFFSICLAAGLFLQSCTDECTATFVYTGYEPVYLSYDELRSSIVAETPREVTTPGKIYIYNQYLLVSEFGKGIHIIDNINPSTPQVLKFLTIPGNVDMSVRNNILYANSYIDLVAIDISDPLNPVEVNRIEDAFPDATVNMDIDFAATPNASTVFVEPFYGGFDHSKGILIDLVETTQTREIEEGCQPQQHYLWERGTLYLANSAAEFNSAAPAPAPNVGIGGSMARFTIINDYLYTVDDFSMQLFEVSNAQNIQEGNRINLGWGIETIFPYKDMIFIGSQTGMHIYDNSVPENPQHLSTYQHIQSCDPVVVQDDLAYVTLRSGNLCRNGANQLDVIDIADPTTPTLLANFPMQNPHGLGIDGNDLFICEGQFGLKRFDASEPEAIGRSLKEHISTHDAFDVIPYNDVLIMVGKDGIYQYDYSNPDKLEELSVIPRVQIIE